MDERVTRVAPPISEARRDVLYALRRRGDARVDDIAASLGITVTGARAHLTALVEQGLVTSSQETSTGRGRPRHRFRVTDTAQQLFPTAYGELTNELLGHLDDSEMEAQLFDRRRDQRISRARDRMGGLPLADRVAVLTEILDADGYMATCEEVSEGVWIVAEQNCAIAAVAREHPAACRSEIDFIRAVLPDATVERTQHIVAGDVRCAYRITTPVSTPVSDTLQV
jgi:predicted ArsR family transcriptional regulator